MYTVGEFSRIAQVSKRLLRYYDQIDLLKPDHSDPATGYRYYSAGQMTELNRILALRVRSGTVPSASMPGRTGGRFRQT